MKVQLVCNITHEDETLVDIYKFCWNTKLFWRIHSSNVSIIRKISGKFNDATKMLLNSCPALDFLHCIYGFTWNFVIIQKMVSVNLNKNGWTAWMVRGYIYNQTDANCSFPRTITVHEKEWNKNNLPPLHLTHPPHLHRTLLLHITFFSLLFFFLYTFFIYWCLHLTSTDKTNIPWLLFVKFKSRKWLQLWNRVFMIWEISLEWCCPTIKINLTWTQIQ